MDKRVLIISMVIIAIVSAGAVAAISMNYDPDMKTASFDGIKMKVPSNAKFTKTAAGFEDSKYGISVQTFKSNESIVNYLKTLQGANMISVANLPANAVAYQQGDVTYVLVTNGQEAICVGALDKDLDLEMANSVIFNNGKKTKVSHGVAGTGIGKNTPDIDVDFIFIGAILLQVNTLEFNQENFFDNASYSINLTEEYGQLNNDWDPNNDINVEGQPETGNDVFVTNGTDSGNSYLKGESGNGFLDSDDPFNTGIVTDFIGDDDNDYSSGDIVSDGSSDVVSDDSSSSPEEDLSEMDCQQRAEDELPDGCTITDSDLNGDEYVFEVEDETGSPIGTISVNSKTGQVTKHLH